MAKRANCKSNISQLDSVFTKLKKCDGSILCFRQLKLCYLFEFFTHLVVLPWEITKGSNDVVAFVCLQLSFNHGKN